MAVPIPSSPRPRGLAPSLFSRACFIALLAIMAIAMHGGTRTPHVDTPGFNVSSPRVASSPPINVTAFWDDEKSRVEAIPLDLAVLGSNLTFHDGQAYNRTDMEFATPNWVDASPAVLRVRATLFTPANESGLLPGVIVIHGTGQNRHQYFTAGLSYAALGCAVLVLDLVGHGESEGPKPSATNTMFEGDFNKTSYHYLAFCNGLQAVRLMRSITGLIDTTRIAITGHSLGGMTSMVVSAIYHDEITISLPSGMLNITRAFPETSILNLVNLTYDQFRALPPSKWDWINPVNYVSIPRYPSSCTFAGTNDEYFAIEGINDVWTALRSSSNDQWFQVVPNGHHKYPTSQAPHYLLRHVFFGGPSPPSIMISTARKEGGIMERFNVDADIHVPYLADIALVELCYRYVDITGEPWRSLAMSPAGNGTWSGAVETPWISSRVSCFVKVTMDAGGTIWFTSTVVDAGMLTNALGFLPVAGICIAIAGVVAFQLVDRHRFEVRAVSEKARKAARGLFVGENIVIGGTEAMKFVSMGMSWLNYGPTLSWSLIYIMNAYFTYDGAFKGFAFFFNGLIITIFLAALVLGFFNPLVSGLLNSAWPACFALLASMLASSLGSSISSRMLGPGYYTFLGVAIAQIVTWIVKRVYHAKLGIPARTLLGVLKAAKRSRLKKARGSEPI